MVARHESHPVLRPHEPLRIEEVPTPTPAPRPKPLIKVKACGICASDLHIFAGEIRGFDMPGR